MGRIKHICKQAATINKNLELIIYQSMRVFDEMKFSGIPFTMDELIARLKGKEEKPTLLTEYLKTRINDLRLKAGMDYIHYI